ncbi:MAG TPA: hypothetical protein VGK73_37140 [Polyangiaceae bacterium]
MFKPTFAAATLGTLLAAASCTLITDVDRTKIPTDTSGGTSGSGGTGSAGKAGSGSGGDAGDGTSGGSAGQAGDTGSGGTGGNPVTCSKATGTITLEPSTFLANGDKLTIGDGVHDPVVFEFDLNDDGVADGNVPIVFDGTENEAQLAVLIADAINAAEDLDVSASAEGFSGGEGGQGGQGAGGEAGAAANGEAGAVASGGGEGGAPGSAGAESAGAPAASGGQGGDDTAPPAPTAAFVELTNDAYGELGNVTISDTVGNPNFKRSGLSGGDAHNCDQLPTLCADDSDCSATCNTETSLCEAP